MLTITTFLLSTILRSLNIMPRRAMIPSGRETGLGSPVVQNGASAAMGVSDRPANQHIAFVEQVKQVV